MRRQCGLDPGSFEWQCKSWAKLFACRLYTNSCQRRRQGVTEGLFHRAVSLNRLVWQGFALLHSHDSAPRLCTRVAHPRTLTTLPAAHTQSLGVQNTVFRTSVSATSRVQRSQQAISVHRPATCPLSGCGVQGACSIAHSQENLGYANFERVQQARQQVS